jgi:adenine deaminase
LQAEPAHQPHADVAERHHRLEEVARDLGCTATAPFALLSFMALSVIPAARVTDQGLITL